MSDKQAGNGRAAFYAIVWPRLIVAARSCGYALGLHGSMARDLDLIAVPWVEGATPAEYLVRALAEACGVAALSCGSRFANGAWEEVRFPTAKPHGRRVWTFAYGGDVYIDLSVMPLVTEAAGAGDRLAAHTTPAGGEGVGGGQHPPCPDCSGSGDRACRTCDGAGVLGWVVRDPAGLGEENKR